MKIYRIQRFQPGHPFYTTGSLSHNGNIYDSVFGQCVKEDGTFMHYTLERKDTLIDEGVYKYDFFYSNANKCTVPRLARFLGALIGAVLDFIAKTIGVDISQRELEHHIANFAYELKGCCAHGKSINLAQTMLQGSGIAFHELINDMNGETGVFIYEKFIN